VEFFSKNHTVVTLDLAGHGQSGCDRRRWSMAAFGADVSAVIQELQLDDVILVGHSMGGSVILEVAQQLPERVTALVPIDTFFDVESILSREQAEQFLSPFRADFAGTARSYINDNFFAPETDISLRRAIVRDMSEAPPHVALGSLEELLTYDTPSALRRVHVPIHCINSDTYPTRVDRARRHAPSFDAVFIHSVGHFLMMEKPEEFNRVLSDVVRDLALGEDGYNMPRGT
jgi:pimeloyl-ACP methyl ester carboxylesterase